MEKRFEIDVKSIVPRTPRKMKKKMKKRGDYKTPTELFNDFLVFRGIPKIKQ